MALCHRKRVYLLLALVILTIAFAGARGFGANSIDYTYHADDLVWGHWGGTVVDDPAATNGKACKCLSGNTGQYAQLGPYVPGHSIRWSSGVTVTFRLKTSDNTTSLPVCVIDVVTAGGKTVWAKKTIVGTDFVAPNTYQAFTLSFTTPAPVLPERWEFRVHTDGITAAADFWVDTTSISITPAFDTQLPALCRNGSPVFVIGVYEYPNPGQPETRGRNNKDHLAEYQSAGFNTYCLEVDDAYYGALQPSAVVSELDQANSHGLGVICSMGNWMRTTAQHKSGTAMYNMIQAIKNRPGLLMYGTADEPSFWENNPSFPVKQPDLVEGRVFAESLDSVHKVWVNEVGFSELYTGYYLDKLVYWSKAGRVFSVDRYPVSVAFPANDLTGVGYDAEYCRHVMLYTEPAMGSRGSTMMVLQGQGLAECDTDPNNNGPRPTLAETRYMAYSSIVHGARGVLWWGTLSIEPTSQLWKDIKSVAGQLSSLQGALVASDTASRKNKLPSSSIYLGQQDLEAVEKTVGSDHYLIVINSSKNTISDVAITALDMRPAQNGNCIPVLFENRSIDTSSTTWHDSFGPWDVHVYADKRTIRRPTVSNFTAVPDKANEMKLSWTNPSDALFRGTMIRCSTDHYPTSPTDGSLVCSRQTAPGASDSFVHSSLTCGQKYYYTAFTYDDIPLYSGGVNASSTPRMARCSEVKLADEGAPVFLQDKAVTGVFSTDPATYVSDADRVSGIRIADAGAGLLVGDRVEVRGTVTTYKPDGKTACEKQVSSASISWVSSGVPLAPLAMICRTVGGGPMGQAPGEEDGLGLNCIGSLVKISGRVTSAYGRVFCVDDGSGTADSFGRLGVMVICPDMNTPVSVGDAVSVTGVAVGRLDPGWNANRRCIRVRDYRDVVKKA